MPKKFGTAGPRLILPTVCTSVPVAECSIEAQLLFDRLIAQADDQGRLQGESRVVAALCMPLIKRATEVHVGKWLGELAGTGLIQRYASEGRQLVQIIGWWDNQGSPRRAYPSRYPAPEGWQDRVRIDGTPPPDGPQSADETAADRGQDDGARARGSVPPRPVSPHSVAPPSASARDDDGLTAEPTKEEALFALSEDFKAGKLSELQYERKRRAIA